MALSEKEKQDILNALDVRREDWTPEKAHDVIENNPAQNFIDSGAYDFTREVFRVILNASINGKPKKGQLAFKGDKTLELFEIAKVVNQLVESKITEAGLEIPWPEDFSGKSITYRERRDAEKSRQTGKEI
ncbi:MAG: hypothetical protein AABY33_02395 [Pseudomonadota bacterium]